MPTAHTDDIVKVLGRPQGMRRITGRADVPLNEEGREQAERLAKTAGTFDKVFTSPMDRAHETAKTVDAGAKSEAHLLPWALGEYQGKPVEEAKPKIEALMTKRPLAVPSKGGESFLTFKRRTLEGAQKQQAGLKPGEKVLNITHGRNMRVIDSWLKKGSPRDLSIDMANMTKSGDWSKTGKLTRAGAKGLESVETADKPGIYYARHGATDWGS